MEKNQFDNLHLRHHVFAVTRFLRAVHGPARAAVLGPPFTAGHRMANITKCEPHLWGFFVDKV
jgi:hypothetical protein